MQYTNPSRVIAHIPFYAQSGFKYETWFENFTDRNGNEALLTYVKYSDNKGKEHTTVIRVKWL